MKPELAIALAIVVLVGFALGYGVRSFISYQRHKRARWWGDTRRRDGDVREVPMALSSRPFNLLAEKPLLTTMIRVLKYIKSLFGRAWIIFLNNSNDVKKFIVRSGKLTSNDVKKFIVRSEKLTSKNDTFEPKAVSKFRNKANDATVVACDMESTGKVRGNYIIPDKKSEAATLAVDRNGDNRPDVVFVDFKRAGKWELSFWDEKFDGHWTLVGYHGDGTLKPSRFESYETFQKRLAQRQ